jgi:hypothetical protein
VLFDGDWHFQDVVQQDHFRLLEGDASFLDLTDGNLTPEGSQSGRFLSLPQFIHRDLDFDLGEGATLELFATFSGYHYEAVFVGDFIRDVYDCALAHVISLEEAKCIKEIKAFPALG